MQARTNSSIDRYVGLPWRDGGRDFDGVDCYGLVWLWFRHEVGLRLPRFDHAYANAADRSETAPLIEAGCAAWRSVAIRPGAVALVRRGRDPAHVALVAPGRRLLHIDKRDGLSCLVPLTEAWRRRMVGCFAPVELVGRGSSVDGRLTNHDERTTSDAWPIEP